MYSRPSEPRLATRSPDGQVLLFGRDVDSLSGTRNENGTANLDKWYDCIHPDDIEPSFAFLCSAESDAITGQVLCVDHGLVHY